MLRRLLCLIGRHRWVNVAHVRFELHTGWRRLACTRCKKRKWMKWRTDE